MASLCLPNSRLFVGLDLSRDAGLAAELGNPSRPAALLYPAGEARDLASAAPSGSLTLVLLDGTWSQVKKLLRHNPGLAALPRYSLSPPPTEYLLRQEPKREYVSTVEALAHALAVLEGSADGFQALLAPLRKLVAMQLEHKAWLKGGLERHRQRWSRQPTKAPRLPQELNDRFEDLVCVVGEANAWNATLPGAHPDELVQWLACRPATGELFEAVLVPREPLAPSTLVHTRLTPSQLAAGVDAATFFARWGGFRRESDLVCSWGRYSLDLIERLGAALPQRRIDLRKVVGDLLQASPGSLADAMERSGLSATPLGSGRGGERLGQLVAVVRHLSARAVRQPKDGP